jgi:hypothetical protein
MIVRDTHVDERSGLHSIGEHSDVKRSWCLICTKSKYDVKNPQSLLDQYNTRVWMKYERHRIVMQQQGYPYPFHSYKEGSTSLSRKPLIPNTRQASTNTKFDGWTSDRDFVVVFPHAIVARSLSLSGTSHLSSSRIIALGIVRRISAATAKPSPHPR